MLIDVVINNIKRKKEEKSMWKNKKNQWTKKRMRRGEVVAEKLARKKYKYEPSREAISYAYYESHRIKYYYGGDLIGVQAFEEVIMFLRTIRTFQSPICWYELALKATLEKMRGKKFINERENVSVISSTSDVNQTIREVLRTTGIKEPVQQFVMEITEQNLTKI